MRILPLLCVVALVAALAPEPADAQSAGVRSRGHGPGPGSSRGHAWLPAPGSPLGSYGTAHGSLLSGGGAYFRFGSANHPDAPRLGYSPYRYSGYPYAGGIDPYTRVRVSARGARVEVGFPIYAVLPATRIIEVHTEVVAAAPAVAHRSAAIIDTCALVTVLAPDGRGHWHQVRLPAMGARTIDELQRVIAARISEGAAFSLRDAAGSEVSIPAGPALDRVLVAPCR
jgi:hypothetical protein